MSLGSDIHPLYLSHISGFKIKGIHVVWTDEYPPVMAAIFDLFSSN